jgi:hypothetical protein
MEGVLKSLCFVGTLSKKSSASAVRKFSYEAGTHELCLE